MELGGLSTIIGIGVSLFIVARHRTQATANGAVIAIPAAFSAVGGSFLHEHQLMLAFVPALFLLKPTRSIMDSSWALVALIIPFASLLTLDRRWPTAASVPSIVLAFCIAWALVYFRSREFGDELALRKASVITAGWALVFLVLAKLRPVLTVPEPTLTPIALQNASIEWKVFCDAVGAAFQPAIYPLLVKLPLWGSVIAVAVSSAKNVETL